MTPARMSSRFSDNTVRAYARNGGRLASCKFRSWSASAKILILVPALCVMAADSPNKREVLERVAANGSLFERERARYSYRQSFRFYEIGRDGPPGGDYREVREVGFTSDGERQEEFVKRPVNRLKRIILTEEDFRDIREVQPFVLTEDTLWFYGSRYEGEENVRGHDCWVFRIKPRQVLDGQRLLDGRIWVDKETEQAVQVGGLPVPQEHRSESGNLFPRFITVFEQVDGKYWFPVSTIADDTLAFSSGGQRVKYEIEFSDYKRFSAESSISFSGQD